MRPSDHPMVTMSVAVLFVLGLLYKGWVTEIRDWIEAKVSGAMSTTGATNPGPSILGAPPGDNPPMTTSPGGLNVYG